MTPKEKHEQERLEQRLGRGIHILLEDLHDARNHVSDGFWNIERKYKGIGVQLFYVYKDDKEGDK